MNPTNDNGAHSFTKGATFETSENINEFLKEEKTMEAIYLQSSLQFGETLKSVSDSDYRRLRDNYDALLKQPLKLGFFVPCDENGNVLDPSDAFKSCEKGFLYGKAKERVLFKGFEFVKTINYRELMPYNRFLKNDEYWNIRFPNRDIESLIIKFEYGIELTDSAIKQIGL